MTTTVFIGLAVGIAVLTVLSIYGYIPALRIVPDDTKFDTTCRPGSRRQPTAALSILAIVLLFTHGLNFGIV